jgi:hypothetical protein
LYLSDFFPRGGQKSARARSKTHFFVAVCRLYLTDPMALFLWDLEFLVQFLDLCLFLELDFDRLRLELEPRVLQGTLGQNFGLGFCNFEIRSFKVSKF